MKKFLRVFIIVVLVLASVGGTCFFFFRNLKVKNNTTVSIAGIFYSESHAEFNQDLNVMNSLINSDSSDKRTELIIKTNNNLDKIMKVLVSYYVESDTKINNEKIAKALNQYNSSKNLLGAMIDEYKIKKDSPYFNRHLGANDFYKQSCVYLINYSRLLNYINSNLNVDKLSDIKFNMFEIYANVVIDEFSSTKYEESKVVIENDETINLMNSVFKVQNSIIVTNVDPFAKIIYDFNKIYYDCNKMEFASNLCSNLETATSESTSNILVATYYFKEIFKI